MKSIYFDITDIVQYAGSHNQVSGIQRVQARVIAELAKKYGGKKIICTYWNQSTKNYCQVPGDGVFSGDEFNPKALLIKLGAVKPSWLVDRGDVKKVLQKYNHRKLYRAFKKAEIYMNALLMPSRLPRLGINVDSKNLDIRPLDIKPLSALPVDDVLVFLGANWSDPTLLDIGRKHREAGGQVVQMIYDLIPYTSPKYFTTGLVEAYTRFLLGTPQYVSAYACISDWTQSDLRQFINGVKDYHPAIQTVPLAHEFSGFTRNQTDIVPSDHKLRDLAVARPFVLCVGTVEIRKNGANLLRAWQRLIEVLGDKTPQLVFAGKYGWKISEFLGLLEADASLAKRVTVVQGPTDRDLAYLYEHCAFSVYPSFYEGWGLPVGEAAWFGRFCLASSATSVPEVCGDLIDYVAPDDVNKMAEKLRFLIENPEYVREKESKIRNAKLSTWETVADDLYAFIQNGLQDTMRQRA